MKTKSSTKTNKNLNQAISKRIKTEQIFGYKFISYYRELQTKEVK
jgi:hypothetical protein